MRGTTWTALSLVALALAACGRGANGPSLVGHWTSQPKAHSESKEAVEFFGEASVQRLHDLGNALTPPIALDLKPDGQFEARGRLTADGGKDGRAWGTWKRHGATVRLSVQGSEGAPGLAMLLILPAEGLSLAWGAAPKRTAAASEDDEDSGDLGEVHLFRE